MVPDIRRGELPSTMESASAFAENLLRGYSTRNPDIQPLFAAYVGVVFQRDPAVGRDTLIALDRFVSAISED